MPRNLPSTLLYLLIALTSFLIRDSAAPVPFGCAPKSTSSWAAGMAGGRVRAGSARAMRHCFTLRAALPAPPPTAHSTGLFCSTFPGTVITQPETKFKHNCVRSYLCKFKWPGQRGRTSTGPLAASLMCAYSRPPLNRLSSQTRCGALSNCIYHIFPKSCKPSRHSKRFQTVLWSDMQGERSAQPLCSPGIGSAVTETG